jgi:hypothetical protein
MLALVTFPDGHAQLVAEAEVEHLRMPKFSVYQVAVNIGRSKRKGKPYPGGDEFRASDGYFHGPETAIILTYKSDLDLKNGDIVLVPVGNHHRPRSGIVIARSSGFDGDLKEITGRFAA